MPTYDMTCRACGTRFERFLTRLLRAEDKMCPSCGSDDVEPGVGGGYVSRPAPTVKSSGCNPRGGFG